MKCKVKKIPKYSEGFWDKASGVIGAAAPTLGSAFGIRQGKAGQIANTLGDAAELIPGIGKYIGAGIKTIGGFLGESGGVDENTGEITSDSGILGMNIFGGHSDDYYKRKSNIIKNTNLATQQSENIKADYYNLNPTGSIAINAAEGGVIPNDEILVGVTAGEVYKNANTGEWGIVKGKGMNSKKPKLDDAERMLIPEGSTIINKHKDYVYSEWGNRTGADIMKPLAKPVKTTGKYAEGTKAAIDAIGKKVLRKQELRKLELHTTGILNKYSNGTPYITKDKLDEAMTRAGFDVSKFGTILPDINDRTMASMDLHRAALISSRKTDTKQKPDLTNYLSTLSDYAPLASALLKKPSYHKEQAYINPVKYVPTGVSIDPIRRATDEGMAIARYNQMNVNPSTGAGMAAGLQAAVNRSKSIADAYKWQQDAQNKLIAQNVGIYNEWAAREAQARHTANTETQQNEAAAMMMRDQAIKDAYEFQTGRRNDRWKLSMLEPMFKYAVDDNIWKKFVV